MRETYDQRWGDRPLLCYCDYVPARFKHISLPLEAARTAVWNFKDGHHQSGVALHTAKLIRRTFGEKAARDITFLCIPASTAESNRLRYCEFSKLVCAMSGTANAFPHVEVTGERIPSHKGGHKGDPTERIAFDRAYFEGRRVLLFDDVVTTGRSLSLFACKLESLGAVVIGAFCMGRTLTSPNHPVINA